MKAGRLPLGIAVLTWIGLVAVVALLTAGSVPVGQTFWVRMLPWVIARAAGLAAFVLLTAVTILGVLLTHPQNLTEWKFSKIMIVWHRYLTVLTAALLALHVVAIILDSYAKVGLMGALVPGQSGYRALPVALGTLTLYGFAVLAVTASHPKWLGGSRWLTIHRFAIGVFALGWLHGVLAGTDAPSLTLLYVLSGLAVLLAYAGRWWAERGLATRAGSVTPRSD